MTIFEQKEMNKLSMQNKSLPQLDELYKEIILDHYREPKGREPLIRVDYKADGMNPLCGDEIILSLQLEKDKIDKVHVEGHGCSISVASGSMLADLLGGKSLPEVREIIRNVKDLMHDKIKDNEIEKFNLGDLEALAGVKKFPVRIKCALLPWTTLEEALAGHDHVEIS